MRLSTNVSSIVSLVILMLGLFIQGYANASQQIVNENFDGGSWGVLGHGATGGDSDGTSITTENSHSGSRSAKVDYSNNRNLNHIWYNGLQNSINNEMYISFWFYHHPNWKADYNHKLMRLTNSFNNFNTNHEFMADADEFFTNGAIHVMPSGDCGEKDNSWYSAPSGTYNKGKWHHWEFYGKLNTNGKSDGIFRLWIDGQQVANKTSWTWVGSGCNPQSSTYKWNTAYFPSNFADIPPSGSTPIYYIDDVEIWDGMPSGTTSGGTTSGGTTSGGTTSGGTTSGGTTSGGTTSGGTTSGGTTSGAVSGATSQTVFSENWESGNKSNWDSSYSIYQVTTSGGISNNSLRLNHVAGSNNNGSVEKGFADNAVSGYKNLSGPRANLVTVETKVKFSTAAFPSDGSTKILTIESWPGNIYPSTSEKSFQAIPEVASNGQLVVTIKREGMDFYTRYPMDDIYIAPNKTYTIKLQVQLDQPYTAANGVLKLWVDGVLQIDRSNEDFILSSRGSDLPKGINMLLIAGYDGGSGSPDSKSQYWDDIELTINGAGSTSISPPNPPSGIQ